MRSQYDFGAEAKERSVKRNTQWKRRPAAENIQKAPAYQYDDDMPEHYKPEWKPLKRYHEVKHST